MTQKTVLIADDEVSIAEILAAVLGDAGYRIETAINGRQVLDRLKSRRPDLILLDYMMPVMDGAATMRALGAEAATRHIPVVIMSSLPEATVAEQCEGYAGFLRKPFRIAAVLDIVARLIAEDTGKQR